MYLIHVSCFMIIKITHHKKSSEYTEVQLIVLKSTVKPAHVVTSISPVLSSHLYFKIILSLSRQRKNYMNWTSFKRSPVLKGHFLFVPQMTSSYTFDCMIAIFVYTFSCLLLLLFFFKYRISALVQLYMITKSMYTGK